MKFEEYSTIQDSKGTSELAQAYLENDKENGTLYDFLQRFEFGSEEEIESAIRTLIYCIVGDRMFADKYYQAIDVHAMCVWRRFRDIAIHSGMDKYPKAVAGEMWNGYFARNILDNKVQRMFRHAPNHDNYLHAVGVLKDTYKLTDLDIEKLHFFVEQVKAGRDFPDSLRRMLYIWGNTKKTGKTTCATMITCILNGDLDWERASMYQSTLQNEMQIGGFKVPVIATCNCVMMDECFFADMGKMYADFKRFLTSRDGKARLPYGQEFRWQGLPNYISTSNEPLGKFIKDWNDRRYLSVEFTEPQTQETLFQAIHCYWWEFIINSERPLMDWQEWAATMYDDTNEIGERQVYSDEFENEMRQNTMLQYIQQLPCNSANKTSNTNRITRKFFVDYFAEHNPEARQRKGEIEAAAIRVFGEKYNGTNFWLLPDLQIKASEIINQNNSSNGTTDNSIGDSNEEYF